MNKSIIIIALLIILMLVGFSLLYYENKAIEDIILYVEKNYNAYIENENDFEIDNINEPNNLDELTSGDIEEEILGDSFDEMPEELIEENVEPLKVVEEKPKNASITASKPSTTPAKTTSITYTMPYYIKVNNAQNVVTIYTKDASGDYTVPYKAMVCSTGTSTPKAGSKYKITTYRREWNGLKGGVYGQYAVQIVGNILFHSVPYTAKDKSTLEYWEYDKLGTKASLGCIRLTVADVKWIYDNVGAGTWVEFYEDETFPGPLGKPTAKKISENEACRNWDPTDNVEGNPWYGDISDSEEKTEPTDISEEINEINALYIELNSGELSSGEQLDETYIVEEPIVNEEISGEIQDDVETIIETPPIIEDEIIIEENVVPSGEDF